MDGGINHHGVLVWVDVDDFLVHLEEVAIFLFNDIAAETLDGIGKVEIDGQAGGAYAVACVATFFGGAGGNIAGHEVAESGIATFEVVVAVFFRNIFWTLFTAADGFGVLFLFGHPDTAVVAEAFAHEGEFGLVVAVDGDAGGVNLDVAGVGKSGAFFVADPGSGAVAVHGVGGEVVDVAVATCGKDDGMGGKAFDVAGDEVAGDDAAGASVDNDEVHHFVAFMEFDAATGYFAAKGTVGTEEELLAGLTAGIESAADLSTAEGAVVEESTIVAGEGYTLGNTLVDDAATDFSQTVDVGFAGTVIATFDGIAEKTLDAVAVVLIVLGCIDAALGSDGVCTAGGILNAEYVDIEAHGTQRSGSRGTGKACTHNNDVDFTLVGRVYKFLTGFVVGPFFGEGTFGYFGI